MELSLVNSELDINKFSELFNALKSFYCTDAISPVRREYIANLVKTNGYLPYSHIQALEELSDAEVLIGVEAKLENAGVYRDGQFESSITDVSPVVRAGFSNSSWVKAEQHNIKLTNLAGLGNGNRNPETGKLIDWLRQVLILPAGNLEKGVLGTTIYMIPFHPRDFGCAYLPIDTSVSQKLEDPEVKGKTGLDAKGQLKFFLGVAQLCGHPTMYDVLPQTGRFSRLVLASPYIARWYDIHELIDNLVKELDSIADSLTPVHHAPDVHHVKDLIAKNLKGEYQNVPDHLKHLFDVFEKELEHKKNWLSNEMLVKANQEKLHLRARAVINKHLGYPEDKALTETDVTDHGGTIGKLVEQGLWPAPGGAWCSCGVPIFDKMSEGAGYPMFKHYDYEGNDVTHFANLNIQTPYYFVYFETGEYNEEVINFYLSYLKGLQREYHFDAFRVDHIDHIVDKYSEEDGRPISYRAPKYVLGLANETLKKVVPHCATLAEYMLWDNFYKEYHQDMHFDLLWGNDIVSQYLKDVETIIEDNKYLEEYNATVESGKPRLSILKMYNNQDGEFEAIDQYPGQLSEDGALFKFFKYKFLPGGKLAQRPVLYVDGDESFTKRGIEKAINTEESAVRENHPEFFRKFNAVNKFALNNDFTRYGKSELYIKDGGSGLVSWYIRNENSNDSERLLVVANEHAPTEKFRDNKEDGTLEIIDKVGQPVTDVEVSVPEGFRVVSEIKLSEGQPEFVESSEVSNLHDGKFRYGSIAPAQFFIYKIAR